MDRKLLVQELLESTRACTEAHLQYMSVPREYVKGSILYMRETHFVCLIDENRPEPINNIAEKLSITQGAVSQIAKRLEEKGFIERVSDPKDRRGKLVLLTTEGIKLKENHAQYDKLKFEKLSEILARFSNEDLKMISEYENLAATLFKENKFQDSVDSKIKLHF